MCADDQVAKVSRVVSEAGGRYSRSGKKSKRGLQSTVSEAGNAHGVSTDDHCTMYTPTSSRVDIFLPAMRSKPFNFTMSWVYISVRSKSPDNTDRCAFSHMVCLCDNIGLYILRKEMCQVLVFAHNLYAGHTEMLLGYCFPHHYRGDITVDTFHHSVFEAS